MAEETGVVLKNISAEKITVAIEKLYALQLTHDPEVKASSVDTSVWVIDSANIKGYAKFYSTKDYSLDLVQDEVRLYDFLNSHGVNAPFVIPGKNGEKVQSVEIDGLDLAIILMRYEELTILNLESITHEEIIKVAKAVAKLNKTLMEYPDKSKQPIERLSGIPTDLVENLLKSPNKSEFSAAELEKVIITYKKAQQYLDQNPINFEELTKSVLHSDLMLNHAPLLPNGEIYFFDFADRWYGPISWDLAIMINNLYRGGVVSLDRWDELQRWFLEGYVQEIQLKPADYMVLKQLMIIHCGRGTNYLNISAIKLGHPDGPKGVRKSWVLVDYLLQNELVFSKLALSK